MSKKSDLVSGMGVAMNIVTSLVSEVKKRGGDDEDIHRLTTPEGAETLGQIAELIATARLTLQTFQVTVDYSRSLKEMIKVGNYEKTNPDITSDHFPVKGEGKREVSITLFQFHKWVEHKKVITEMEQQDYRPAKIEELLALGAEHPKLQLEYPIVAPGFIWQSPGTPAFVPCLGHLGSEVRTLDIHSISAVGGYPPEYRLAAVRK
jgi:hypothetical protein